MVVSSDTNEKLTEENKKLQVQLLEQKQQIDEMNDRLKFYSRVSWLHFRINAGILLSVVNVCICVVE